MVRIRIRMSRSLYPTVTSIASKYNEIRPDTVTSCGDEMRCSYSFPNDNGISRQNELDSKRFSKEVKAVKGIRAKYVRN